VSSCHDHCDESGQSDVSGAYRKVLWICLIANAVMFVAQMIASYAAHSVSLLANSADFFSDAANYGISLYVLNLSLRQKAKASLFKGISLGVVGLWVAFETLHHSLQPELPEPLLMVIISVVALTVNVGCADDYGFFHGSTYRMIKHSDENRQGVERGGKAMSQN
jgi:Co/Zn/Cd efflux system component